MSIMEGLYFQYLGQKPTLNKFLLVRKELIPHNMPIVKEVDTDNGFIVNFAQEKCANVMYSQSFKDKLKKFKMTAELTHITQRDRLVFLPDIPDFIYNKDIATITDELVTATDMRILKVDKFPGKNNNRKYITITADSRTSRETIITKGTLKLFGHYITPQHPIPKGQSTSNMRSATSGPEESHIPSGQTGAGTNIRSHTTPHHSPASVNPWATNPSQAQQRTCPQGPRDVWPSISTSEGRRSITPTDRKLVIGKSRDPDFKCDFDTNFYIQSLNLLSKTLQEGLEKSRRLF